MACIYSNRVIVETFSFALVLVSRMERTFVHNNLNWLYLIRLMNSLDTFKAH